jgi:hypothetical protein
MEENAALIEELHDSSGALVKLSARYPAKTGGIR